MALIFLFCKRFQSIVRAAVSNIYVMSPFARLLVLSKNQQLLITNNSMVLNQNSIHIFFLKKGMTNRVPVKGNCVNSGPNLVAGTLSRLLLSYQTG